MATRYEDKAHARYLTFGCYHHYHLFQHSDLCQLFLDHLDRIRKQENIHVWAYVIMPDHVHLLVYSEQEKPLGSLLSRLKSEFAFKALKWIEEHDPITYEKLRVEPVGKVKLQKPEGHPVGHPKQQRGFESKGKVSFRFWQRGGGYDRNIHSDEAIRKSMEYIHNNPVKVGIVNLPEKYQWSSAGYWLVGDHSGFKPDEPFWWRDSETRP